MSLICSFVPLVVWGALPLSADTLPRARPESVGMSSDRLAQIGVVMRDGTGCRSLDTVEIGMPPLIPTAVQSSGR